MFTFIKEVFCKYYIDSYFPSEHSISRSIKAKNNHGNLPRIQYLNILKSSNKFVPQSQGRADFFVVYGRVILRINANKDYKSYPQQQVC